jgi:hypothetical protein
VPIGIRGGEMPLRAAALTDRAGSFDVRPQD